MRSASPRRIVIAVLIASVPVAVSFLLVGYLDFEKYPRFAGILILLFVIWAFGVLRFLKELPRRADAARRSPQVSEDAPTVLYLRSFEDDSKFDLVKASPRRVRLRFGLTRDFEQLVGEIVGRHAHIVAIGRPSEILPPLGAAREYVSGDKWQDHIGRRAKDAEAIVGVLGKTKGFTWELEFLQHNELLPFTVLLVPPVGLEELARRWEVLREAIGGFSLPETPPEDVICVCFDHGSNAEVSTSELMKRKPKKPAVVSTDNYEVPLSHILPALRHRRQFGDAPPLSMRVYRATREKRKGKKKSETGEVVEPPEFLPPSESFEPPRLWRPWEDKV